MVNPVIRPVLPSDASALADGSNQLGYPASADQVLQRLNDISRAGDQMVFVACQADGSVVGWIHVFGALRVESNAFAELGGLVVAEPHRGRGVGGMLVGAAEKWAQSQGLPRLRVRTRPSRVEALSFYDRLGFKPKKEQRVLDKVLGPNSKDVRKGRGKS